MPPAPGQPSAGLPAPVDVSTPAISEAVNPGAPLSFEHVVFAGERTTAGAQCFTRPRRRPEFPRRDADPAVDPVSAGFFEWVCRGGGLQVSRYRTSVFRRRTGACLRALRVSSIATAWEVVERDISKNERVIDALMIGVTQFFRDREVFEALGGLLGDLARSSPASGVRVMSVGCSDGSELYSVAMMLAEHGLLGPDRGLLWGIDCRSAAISAAASGVFSHSAVSQLPAALRNLYFEPAGRGVRIIEPLRAACRWERRDAFSGPEREVDLLLCRNLAIYLEHAASRDLWTECVRRLRPGGVLVVGKAERPVIDDGPFSLDRIGPCLYRKVEVPA
jgi:chemotaxis protein methyltransferase CheR